MTLFVIIGVVVCGGVLYATQWQVQNSHNLRAQSQQQINQMDCQELKARVQGDDGTEDQSSDEAGQGRAATRYYYLGCDGEWGYFDYDHDDCAKMAVGRYDPRFCLQKAFPMYNGLVQFPQDYFYKDPITKKIIDDPDTMLEKRPWNDDYFAGVDLNPKTKGVKNPNLIPFDCFSGFTKYQSINKHYPYRCNYNMTVNGVVHDRKISDGILHTRHDIGMYTIILSKVPNFKEMECWEINDQKYSHQCKYFGSTEFTVKVERQ